MSTNLLLCFNYNDISRIFFRTFFLPISTCSGTSSGKGSSNQIRLDDKNKLNYYVTTDNWSIIAQLKELTWYVVPLIRHHWLKG